MNDFNFLGIKEHWNILGWWGISHPLLRVTVPTLIATWVVIFFVIVTLLICRVFLSSEKSIVRHVILEGVEGFMDLCSQSLGTFNYKHFSFITALFVFILYCNLMGVLPFLEEPTADLNTTLALGTISFLYINYYAIQAHGLKGYISEYFQPFFLMFPLNVIGKLASIISISFRLFGNLLGGSVISTIYMTAVGNAPSVWYMAWLPPLGAFCSIGVSIFFGIFEGFIQAFVFAMLSLTYLSLETHVED